MASIRSRPSSIKSNYSSISTASSSPSMSSDEELQTPQTSPLLHPVDHSNLDWNPDGSTSSDQCPLCSSHDKSHALNQSLPSISKLTPMLPMLPEPQMPIATTSFDNGKQRAIESRHAVIAAEEERRGRSRWPRLLFFLSTIDKDSRDVLERYHVRTTGQSLPVLDQSHADGGVKEFDMALNRVGL